MEKFNSEISSKNKGEYIYLLIDPKFPADIYNHIVSVSDAADPVALKLSIAELKQQIH
ncbi:hypothetical protein [Lacrimispora amygdalina]|uniref:hypothetical protein n=1 Tax=Lacrimispora amygdalina TaxID=253257 RepID=UPI001407EA39|nr:hypothetical protein [Lacrimispora amygdalina]